MCVLVFAALCVCSVRSVWLFVSPPLQVEVLLDSLINTFGEVEMVHKKPGSLYPWQPVYRRYMEVLKRCILQIYHD